MTGLSDDVRESIEEAAPSGISELEPGLELVVIIPTVQIDAWLEAAVLSVLNQEGVDARIVVVHDGVEPDWSQEWMKSPTVTVIRSPERIGLSGVLVKAISETTEVFIARLDADDIASPGRLAEQLAYLTSHPETVLLGSQGTRIDESGEFLGNIDLRTGPDVRLSLLTRNALIHPSVMFRRDAYIAAGGYDERLRMMEDYDLWLRMGLFGEVAVLASRSVSYRIHAGQMSRGAKPYGIHIRKILSSHRQLANCLGVNPVVASARAGVWLAAQFLRYWGIRRPGRAR